MSVNLITETETFFGDGTYRFKLTAPLIAELERSTGTGIGGLAKRIFANDYRFNELAELIRLALIGAGQTPQRAKELVETYVNAQPIAASLPVALAILEAAFFGVDPQTRKEPA